MKFQGALITEQNVTFGIVIVKAYVLSSRAEADRLIASFQAEIFGGHPVVLMPQDQWGTPRYYGRQDIVKFLASVPLASVPWKEYTLG